MVVTGQELATREALEVLKKGGNAVDAAVTASFVMAVTLPRAGNIGGGGFMLIHNAGRKEVIALDRTIAELSIHYQQQGKEIQTQWAKIDANHREIEAVDRKADEWINKGRGAWFTLMVLGGLAQAVVLGSIAYTFGHLRTAEDTVLLMNQRVIQLEQHKEARP
jgi:hypothetical protein